MEFKLKNYKKNIQWMIVIFLSLFLGYNLIQIIINLRELKREGMLTRRAVNRSVLKPKVTDIQSWMTFRYINVVFNLQPDYLKNGLSIQDKSYPNISISALAKKIRIPTTELLIQTQQMVKVHIEQSVQIIPAS